MELKNCIKGSRPIFAQNYEDCLRLLTFKIVKVELVYSPYYDNNQEPNHGALKLSSRHIKAKKAYVP